MAFIKKEWKDRLAEFAGRRTLTDIATGISQTVDVTRAEGQISQIGDAFSAQNMNDLEQRIGDAIWETNQNVDKLSSDLSTCKLITEGAGAATKYFIQRGADTASKKELGSGDITLTLRAHGGHTSNGGTNTRSHCNGGITISGNDYAGVRINSISGATDSSSGSGPGVTVDGTSVSTGTTKTLSAGSNHVIEVGRSWGTSSPDASTNITLIHR